ncbi:DUF2281 domain-containing protein [Salmonirosea aquatica]|uniref:DUF2281 domain-containing protein n=1 Tax=Salmonirosea aquatica TaxID=2654236 RepID=A0A7C9FR03_9BACT|nr:DUF2281 domain-containing protein [Cytophagaceae bacterium SJW1-29]
MKTLTLQIPDTLDLEKESQLKKQMADYLAFLLKSEIAYEQAKPERVPRFGCAKGKFRMAEDFDAPIDHFNDYMPE